MAASSEGSSRDEGPDSGGGSGPAEVAAYNATIRAGAKLGASGRDFDATVLELLETRRRALEGRLSSAASKRFGAAFVVELRSARPANSVVATIVLKTVYTTTRLVAVTAERLRSFELDISQAIGEALQDHAGPTVIGTVMDEDSLVVTPEDDAGSWDRMAPILAAVATGVGVLGFVAFVGGAIQFARFRGAGLAAEDALTIVPNQTLVVTGAQTLVPALVVGLIAAMGIFLWRALGREEGEHADLGRAFILVGYVGLVEILYFVFTLDFNGSMEWVALLVGIPVIAVCAVVATKTDRALYLASTALIAVSLFLGGTAFARAWDNEEVRAAAIVRDNKQAVVGFWIAEGNDRVYIGRLSFGDDGEVQKRRSRIMAFSKGQVTDTAIGQPKPPEEAIEQAKALANELCDLEIAEVPKPQEDKSSSKSPDAVKCFSRPPGRPANRE